MNEWFAIQCMFINIVVLFGDWDECVYHGSVCKCLGLTSQAYVIDSPTAWQTRAYLDLVCTFVNILFSKQNWYSWVYSLHRHKSSVNWFVF